MDELVSVIIPSYNRKGTIEKALNSVLSQTYSNLEIIVVDDCSTDGTELLFQSISDSKIRYHRLESNSGACVARNTGVSLAKGSIIAFQDSDDIWHVDKLEKQIAYMDAGGFDFVTCGFYRISGEERRVIGLEKCPTDSEELWCSLLNHNWISTQTIVCKRKCFDVIRFDPAIKRYQDWDIGLQASNYFKIGCLNECLVDVFLQDNSITNTVQNYEAMLAVIEKHEKDVRPGCMRMKAQYLKSLADVHRNREGLLAGKEYFQSFCIEPNPKKLLLSILSSLGVMKYYKSRQD